MSSPKKTPPDKAGKSHRRSILSFLRRSFLAGFVITVPLFITFYLMLWTIQILDGWFKPFLPVQYHPETYLPFPVPGVGIVSGLLLITVIGAITANFVGRFLLGAGENLIRQMPVAGTIYRALRQILKSAMRDGGASFSQVALIEYPRKGIYAIAFVTKAAERRVNQATDEPMIGVFLPTTPNPTSGFLLFLPEKELTILDMSVEEGARIVISAGLADDEELTVST